jgi:hypothetical protein
MKAARITAAAGIGIIILSQSAAATPVYGNAGGSTFLVNPANPGGYTAYASIEAAVVAATNAGRTVIEFEGDWSGVSIDETVKLRNAGLTFQGAPGVSMTWASGVTAFGGMNGQGFTATLSNLKLTTTGPSAPGVSWDMPNWGGVAALDLTLSNCTFDTTGDGVLITCSAGGGSTLDVPITMTALDSTIRSSGGSGLKLYEGGSLRSSTVTVARSRIEARDSGVRLDCVWNSAANRMTIQSSEICANAASNAGAGILCVGNTDARPLTIVSTLVAGFAIGVSDELAGADITMARCLLNNTIIGTGGSTGLVVRLGVNIFQNWDTQSGVLVNNIFAGHAVGVWCLGNVLNGASMTIMGEKNAWFANATNRLSGPNVNVTVSFNDANRIEPADYTLDSTFENALTPVLTARNYRLKSSATRLKDAGKQFQSVVLGSGWQTWLDANGNGTYDTNVDCIVDLGGFTGDTSVHRLCLTDADRVHRQPRLKRGAIEIGAYEGTWARGTVVSFR